MAPHPSLATSASFTASVKKPYLWFQSGDSRLNLAGKRRPLLGLRRSQLTVVDHVGEVDPHYVGVIAEESRQLAEWKICCNDERAMR